MKRLGQHFLKDRAALKKIALSIRSGQNSSSRSESGETIIEIGAGHGELTEILRGENPKSKIIAIEKDSGLAEFLRKKFSGDENLKITEGDALKILPRTIADNVPESKNWKLTGNIPYYITGHLLRLIGEIENKPNISVLTIQKEVGERIAAAPPKMNRLAASVQFWAEPKIMGHIPKTAFVPPPEVDSIIIMLTAKKYALPRGKNARTGADSAANKAKKYYSAVRTLFAQPRKTILNNIQSAIGKTNPEKKEKLSEKLKLAGINPQNRPQNLNIKNIIEISSLFDEFGGLSDQNRDKESCPKWLTDSS